MGAFLQKKCLLYSHKTTVLNFVAIFKTNLQIASLMVISGITTFSIFSLIIIFTNASILGASISQVEVFTALVAILPHGVVEITAFILSGFISVRSAIVFLKYIFKDDANVAGEIINLAIIFFFVVLLLAISAFIEANLTPWLINNYLNL